MRIDKYKFELVYEAILKIMNEKNFSIENAFDEIFLPVVKVDVGLKKQARKFNLYFYHLEPMIEFLGLDAEELKVDPRIKYDFPITKNYRTHTNSHYYDVVDVDLDCEQKVVFRGSTVQECFDFLESIGAEPVMKSVYVKKRIDIYKKRKPALIKLLKKEGKR
jgi:hypothetical protein